MPGCRLDGRSLDAASTLAVTGVTTIHDSLDGGRGAGVTATLVSLPPDSGIAGRPAMASHGQPHAWDEDVHADPVSRCST